jgi:HlyD family secretion protein
MLEQETVVRSPESNAPPQPEPHLPAKERRGARRFVFLLLFLIALLAAAAVVWKVFLSGPKTHPDILKLSGRIEGDDSAVAPKTSGRVLEIRVREGDTVKAGDIIAILDDEQLRAREEQANAALLEAEARTKWAQQQIDVLQEQLRQNEISEEQARLDAEGRVRQAEADLAAAESELARQEAAYQLAIFDKEAYSRLARTGAAAERQAKEAASTAAQQEAAVEAAKRRVEATRGALTTARASLANRSIRQTQVASVRRQIEQQQTEIKRASASAQSARAQLTEARANREDLTIKAPFDGMVMTRVAEPGEVLTAGTAIVTLLDPTKVYLRGFVPEGQIGKVKVGQPARVYLDSAPNKPIDAEISRIDPQATFTPENTYFQDERVKQVVGVKLLLKEATGFAKPGMPADGEILVQGEAWPTSGRTK